MTTFYELAYFWHEILAAKTHTFQLGTSGTDSFGPKKWHTIVSFMLGKVWKYMPNICKYIYICIGSLNFE
jgi:hypothetical protein